MQGSINLASRIQDTGSSLAGSALHAAEQAQQAAASAGGTAAGLLVGAAQGLQQRGSASAQKFKAAATGVSLPVQTHSEEALTAASAGPCMCTHVRQ